MTSWTIRRAVTGDASALAKCIDAAYAPYRERIDDLPAVSDGVADDIENHLVWVAIHDRAIVGGLILALQDQVAVLANVAVDPASSRMGIGRGLIEHAEANCRALGKRELRLATHVAMPDNVRLYRHLGWREIGRSGNKVHMTKPL